MSLKKIAFYSAVIIFIVYGQFFMTHGLITGTPPALPERTIQHKQLVLKTLKQPGVIYFWADWCGICTSMQGTISTILNEYPGVTVAVRSGDKEELLAYQMEHKLEWPTLADEQGKLGKQFNIKGVPTLFFLDRQGQIRFTAVGYSSEFGIRLKLWLTDKLY